MAASSSSSSNSNRRYDVFPSFSGEDVRKTFLSHLLMAFERRSINSFIDNEIERSRSIGPELLTAIKEARISIVIFSKNYAASTWCLNELVEIHNFYKELDQMVIPVFHNVDPSEVRKQTGEFGKSFMKTCEGKTDDVKQRWIQALEDVANLAGEHLSNGPSEAHMVEKIANDVSNKLLPPSNGFGDFVGIEAHLGAIKSILYLESEEPRMIGIWGQSGIGKTTLGRALFSHLSTDFHFRNFTTDKPMDKDVSGTKLKWEKEFLSEILDQKDLKIENFGEVKKRLNSKKVLIVLDDVVNPEFLKTLVGKSEWFGSGSIIIVITQDSHLLKAHKIDLLYEVKIPDQDLALKMLFRSAFGGNSPPEGFKELAVEVAKVVGNLPLGLSVLGSSLRGRTIEEWKEFLPGLQTGIKGDIMKTLRVGYDRLDIKEQEIFLWIASLFNGKSVKSINDFFGDSKDGLKRLAEKSLIRITSEEKYNRRNEGIVEMHSLLEALGREIVRAESKGNPPGKRRFLTNAEEILDVFTNQTGTETVVGMFFNVFALESDISIDKNSLRGMSNLQFLHIYNYDRLSLPKGLVYLPPKLKWLEWNHYPLKCLPSNFKAECLVELRMKHSKLEKLWEGTQQLGSLKTIVMSDSKYLKEIPDLSKAINLERVDFESCSKLKSFPSHLNWESLEYLNLIGCHRLKNFPHIRMQSLPHGIELKVNDSLWNKNLPGLDYLDCLRRFFPTKILPEQIFSLKVSDPTMEKLCEGVKPFRSLQKMDLSSFSENLKEIPDLSKATNLVELDLSYCKTLVRLSSTIGNLQKLERLDMKYCEGLEVIPVDVNLSSLKTLNLYGCSSLKSFPQLSRSIEILNLDFTTIEEVPCLIEVLPRLIEFSMCHCSSLTRFPQLSSSIEKLHLDGTAIEEVPCLIEMLPRLIIFSMHGCLGLTSFPHLPPSIEILNLGNTAIEEVPCCIEMLWRLTVLYMGGCNKLKNISPNIFRLTGLEQVSFTDCGDCVITVATMVDPYETTTEKINKVHKNNDFDWYFNFRNCLKLDRDARELIIQSSLKSTVILPGGEVPTYFKHRAFGNFLTITLRNSSLSDQFLRFNVCAVLEPVTDVSYQLSVNFRYHGVYYSHSRRLAVSLWKTDHLVLCSFKFQPTSLPSKLDSKDVEFTFTYGTGRVKEVGVRVLNVSTSPDDRDGRSSKTDVVETETSKNQIQMTSSEQNFNQTCDQVVTDTGLIASKLWIDSMITEQQDAQLTILYPHRDQVRRPDLIWGSSRKTLRVGYDRLDEKEQEIFLWIACLFNGKSVKSINDFFGDSKGGLKRLAEKSLIHITSEEKYNRRNEEIIEMHSLLEALGREIVRAESKGNPPGKCRFLTDAEEIVDVLINQTVNFNA